MPYHEDEAELLVERLLELSQAWEQPGLQFDRQQVEQQEWR